MPKNTVSLSFTPLIIIGAARSGTNILRDTLTRLPGFATWNCDEINAIWRYGNTDWPNDEIPVDRAHDRVKSYIRRQFRTLWRKSGEPSFVVEKTCANTLRVPFVDVILPEAKYLHIVRNGFDVVASSRKRWKGELEIPSLPYFLAKAKYVPLRDIPLYGWQFLKERVKLITGRRERFSTWGPRFSGMDTYSTQSLETLCARQWTTSVEASHDSLALLQPTRVHTVRYEDFVADPESELTKILDFLAVPVDEHAMTVAVSSVSARSIGKGKDLATDMNSRLHEILAPALRLYNYL